MGGGDTVLVLYATESQNWDFFIIFKFMLYS